MFCYCVFCVYFCTPCENKLCAVIVCFRVAMAGRVLVRPTVRDSQQDTPRGPGWKVRMCGRGKWVWLVVGICLQGFSRRG